MATGIGIKLANALFPSSFPNLLWTPIKLGTSLRAWFDPAVGLSQSGNRVSQFVDRSPAGLTLSQATSGNQPLYLPTAQNGRPGVQNDGGSVSVLRYLAGALADGVTNFSKTTPFSFAIALKVGSIAGNFAKTPFGNLYNAQGWALDTSPLTSFGGANQFKFILLSNGVSAGLSVSATTTPRVAGNTVVIVVTYDGSATPAGMSMTINGVAQTLATGVNTLGSGSINNANQTLFMGVPGAYGSLFSDDTVLEAVVSSGVLSSTDIANLSNYFNQKYAIY